jgi:hypothetical protein
MALLRDIRVGLVGRDMTRHEVERALMDNGFAASEARALYKRATSLRGTRPSFCFEAALNADPTCVSRANTTLGAFGAAAPEDIAPGTYAAELAKLGAPRVLIVRANTGVGKTLQCRSLLTARTSGNFPMHASFVARACHVGMIAVASSIAETRAMLEACAGCGYECILYQDKAQLSSLRYDAARRAQAFAGAYSLPGTARHPTRPGIPCRRVRADAPTRTAATKRL